MGEELELLLAERAIARVLCEYSRAADRCDLELMRSCYWPDGTDDHGSYDGDVDGFIEFVGPALQRFERTNHFLGNMLIDVDLSHDVAPPKPMRSPITATTTPTGGRTTWLPDCATSTASNVAAASGASPDGCAPSSGGGPIRSGDGSSFADTYTRGLRGPDDIVWHILE